MNESGNPTGLSPEKTGPALDGAGVFRAEAIPFRAFSDVASLLEGLESGVFQSPFWLDCWYSVFGSGPDVEPYLLVLRNGGGVIVMACPLIGRVDGALKFVEFADLGVSDYAAPLLRRDAIGTLPQGDELWQVLADAMPEADVIRFERLAPEVAGMANPLHALSRTRRNRLAGWVSPPLTSWEAFSNGLSASQQEKSLRRTRRFQRLPEARICIHDDAIAGVAALARLNDLQFSRINDKGLAYQLNTPKFDAFYREMTARGVESGHVLMVELLAGDVMVAANYTVIAGKEAMYLRVANQFGQWANMSPGVIATEQAMQEAIRRGVTIFDFGMGDYVYKRRLRAREVPLHDLVTPLSMRGASYALLWHTRHWAANNPLLRRLTGRAAPPASAESAAAA